MSGGILSVIKELKVNMVIISKQEEDSENYQEFNKITKKSKIPVIIVENGMKLNIEKNVYFDILWPNSLKPIKDNILNNNSIVCKLYYNKFSILFTGDIEEIAEQQVLKEYKENIEVLNSNVLKVAHHGSKTSSSQNFLGAVKPQIALIGVGKNNNFGHPSENIINRLKNMRL